MKMLGKILLNDINEEIPEQGRRVLCFSNRLDKVAEGRLYVLPDNNKTYWLVHILDNVNSGTTFHSVAYHLLDFPYWTYIDKLKETVQIPNTKQNINFMNRSDILDI